MAVAFGSISTNSVGDSNLVVAKPSGTAAGDFLIAYKVIDNVGDTFSMTGFTQISGSPITQTADNQQIAVFTRLADGTEGASFTIVSANSGPGGIIRMTGVDGTTQLDATPVASSNSSLNASPWTVTITGITTVTPNCGLVIIAGDDVNASVDVTHSTPSGFTPQADQNDGFKNIVVFTGTAGAAGATGNFTFTGTAAGNSAGWGGFLLALRPADAGGSPVGPSTLIATVTRRIGA